MMQHSKINPLDRKTKPTLSVVIPAYNEEKNIELIISELKSDMTAMAQSFGITALRTNAWNHHMVASKDTKEFHTKNSQRSSL